MAHQRFKTLEIVVFMFGLCFVSSQIVKEFVSYS